MVGIVGQLFTYDVWAIDRALASLKSAPSMNPKAARLLAHLLIAEQVWYLRMQGENTSAMNLSPELSLEECERLAEENRKSYAAYLKTLSAEKLDSVVTYRNSKGLEFQTSVRDILLHVMIHGAYHRGQIATAVRGEGETPVDTDYITFIREG
jgi:uncharacterized damage-inducible protein DinB